MQYSNGMAFPAHNIHYDYAEYLALESSSNVKHEYLGGQIYAMAGGTPEHPALAAVVIGLLFSQLRGGRCRTLDSDLRVRVGATGLATYPDVTVVCGPWERDREDPHAITNPTLIAEILSKSTEEYDRGDKFEHYKHLASMKQYVLVSPRERTIEVWTRATDDTWSCDIARDGLSAGLESVECSLDVSELFDAAVEPIG